MHTKSNKNQSLLENEIPIPADMLYIKGKFVHVTQREREVIQLLTKGYSAKQTAGLLEISVRTVEAYLSNIRRKVGCRTKLASTVLTDICRAPAVCFAL